MEDINKLLLQQLAENDKLLEAIKEELLKSLNNKKPNLELSNEDLGAEIRAKEEAKEMLKEGLKEIKKLKIIKRSEQDLNPGR